jgi:hypothetical protein
MNQTSAQPRGGNGKAIIIGFLAMILGAGLWALVTVVTAHEFSLVAIGVGALVGLAMFSARPTSTGIAAAAALLTVLGCALGEFLAVPAYVAHKDGISFTKLVNLELSHPKLYFDALDGKTYLFWAIGAAAAFSMVFRRIQAARVINPSYGAGGVGGAYGAGGPVPGPQGYAPQQQFGAPGAAPQPGGTPQPGQPYPGGQQPYGQGQPPYGQNPQPYGQGQQPYGPGQQPGPGQQYPPR